MLQAAQLHAQIMPCMHDAIMEGLRHPKDAQTRARALHFLQVLLAAGHAPRVPQWEQEQWHAFVALYRWF